MNELTVASCVRHQDFPAYTKHFMNYYPVSAVLFTLSPKQSMTRTVPDVNPMLILKVISLLIEKMQQTSTISKKKDVKSIFLT